jgi:hypothetical protein
MLSLLNPDINVTANSVKTANKINPVAAISKAVEVKIVSVIRAVNKETLVVQVAPVAVVHRKRHLTLKL